MHRIINKHGGLALYDGLPADAGATLLSNFLYFYIYSFLRNSIVLRHKVKAKLGLGHELVLGFMAGVASRAISLPLNMIALRMQSEDDDEQETDSPAFTTVVKRIYQEQGLLGFWSGFQMSVLLSLNPSITLALFQLYRRIIVRARNPSPREAFLGGAVSSSIAIALLYPLILAKTRLQARKSGSLRAVLLQRSGQYQGLEMQTIKGFLSQGVTFLVKGRIEQLVVWAYRQSIMTQ